MKIDGKEFPVLGKVYSDTEAVLQKFVPSGFGRANENPDMINARYIEWMHEMATCFD